MTRKESKIQAESMNKGSTERRGRMERVQEDIKVRTLKAKDSFIPLKRVQRTAPKESEIHMTEDESEIHIKSSRCEGTRSFRYRRGSKEK